MFDMEYQWLRCKFNGPRYGLFVCGRREFVFLFIFSLRESKKLPVHSHCIRMRTEDSNSAVRMVVDADIHDLYSHTIRNQYILIVTTLFIITTVRSLVVKIYYNTILETVTSYYARLIESWNPLV